VLLPLDRTRPSGLRRYRLTVFADSVSEMVRAAGGWLCDQARTGWDVRVVLARPQDVRALTILGASAVEADQPLADIVRSAGAAGALAVSGRLLVSDEAVRSGVEEVLRGGRTAVMVWGSGAWDPRTAGSGTPTGVDPDADAVEHRLSAAARAFKSCALVAAGSGGPGPVDGVETLLTIGPGALRPVRPV